MLKRFFIVLMCCASSASFGNTESVQDVVRQSEQLLNVARIVCSGISDEISKVSNVSKANTAGVAIGGVGVATSAAAKLDEIMRLPTFEQVANKMRAASKSIGKTIVGGADAIVQAPGTAKQAVRQFVDWAQEKRTSTNNGVPVDEIIIYSQDVAEKQWCVQNFLQNA